MYPLYMDASLDNNLFWSCKITSANEVVQNLSETLNVDVDSLISISFEHLNGFSIETEINFIFSLEVFTQTRHIPTKLLK